MPHDAAFSLGDTYCHKVDRSYSLGEIEALTYKMIRDFCIKVGNIKAGSGYSLIVRKCQNYIYEHLHEEIRLHDLANFCNVSSRSITSHFKKALNMSIPEYITKEKLKESQYLLTNTDYSRVFREAFGCTPQQNRCSNPHL